MLTKKTSSILFCGLMAAFSSAQAQESNWYVGGEVGRSDFSLKLPNGYTTSSPGVSQDKTDTAFGALVGYKATSYLNLEAGYLDLGKYKVSVDGEHGSAKISGFTLNALWKLQVSPQWTLFAKTGIMAARAKGEVQTTGASYSEKKNSVVPVIGIGVDYAVDRNWTVRGQYQDIGAAKLVEEMGSSIKMHDKVLSFGVNYNF
ncbi:MAG: outer membrane beta-barrel protein [Pseudomonadota bacterium]|jgi:OOP family OmpA-OmpF porin